MSSEAPADHVITPMPEPTGTIGHIVGLVRTKGLRYCLVAGVNVVVGQALLFALQGAFGPVWANVLAVGISSVPAYYMNRSWVWGKSGKSHMRKEVVPFWAFTLAGLALSSLAIWILKHFTQDKLAVGLVQLVAFGILWVVRFFVLDKLFHVEVFEDDTPDLD